MLGILFLQIFHPKHPQLIKNGVSKQSSSCQVFRKDQIKYLETIKNMEEQKWNGKLVRFLISNSIL